MARSPSCSLGHRSCRAILSRGSSCISGLLTHAMRAGSRFIFVVLKIHLQESTPFESECAVKNFQLYQTTVQETTTIGASSPST